MSTVSQIISKHREKLDPQSIAKLNSSDILHVPLRSIWKGSVDEMQHMENVLKQVLTNKLVSAWDVSERWINEYRQEITQQPHDTSATFEKYISYYRSLLEHYQPFNYWALEYWLEPRAHISKHLVDGMWGQLFILCLDNDLEFAVGLEIAETVFAANLTVAKLSRERVDQITHEKAVDELMAKPYQENKDESESSLVKENERSHAGTFVAEFRDQSIAADIIAKLQVLYKGRRKKAYAYMLYALYDLGFINHPATINQQRLHIRLKATFGDVGARQNLNKHLTKLNAPRSQESTDIQYHKQMIAEAV